MKKFDIIKNDTRKKVAGEWIAGDWTKVIATIEAMNRREAFNIYCETISKSYSLDRRSLRAQRRNKNKRRRVETITVAPSQD